VRKKGNNNNHHKRKGNNEKACCGMFLCGCGRFQAEILTGCTVVGLQEPTTALPSIHLSLLLFLPSAILFSSLHPPVRHTMPFISSSSLCAALFVVALVASTCAAPPYSCTYKDPNNVNYDLSNMYRDPTQGQQDYSIPSGSDTYYVNVCGEAQETQCNPLNGVCQVTATGAGYGNGDASQATWDALRMCNPHSIGC
jgi:hypothetical protein